MAAALALASVLPAAGATEAPSLRAMTLPEALAFAAGHQPSLLAARARLEAARRESELPRGYWYPRVGATLQVLAGTANNSTASYFSTSAMDLPRIGGTKATPPTNWGPQASTLAGIGVRQELFDFGRISAMSNVFDFAAEAESARADQSRLDLALLVEEAYLGVHVAKAVLRTADAAEQRVRLHRDLAEAGVKSGLRSPIELTRAEADLARFQVGRVRAAGGVDVSRAVFAAAVGVPDPSLDVAGQPPEPSPAPPDEARARAADRDPGVREAHALRLQQEGITRLVRAELLPDLTLSAGLSGRAGGASPTSGAVPWGGGWVPDVPNWDIGLLLSWPIFDAASLARASASVERERQRAAEEDLSRQRSSTLVAVSTESLRVAAEAVPALQRAAQAAAANYEQAEARFKAGLGSSVELADAESLRLQAEVELAVGSFERARARARLARALAEGL